MTFAITWRPKISLLLCTAIRACPRPGTLNTEPLASMEMLLTGLSFGPGSGSANVTSTAGGWDYGSINDLERWGLESLVCLCSLGMVWGGRIWPSLGSSLRLGACQMLPALPHILLPHAFKLSETLIICVTQCPSRLANTSSPDLIFPEIWLMLVLPPKKGCQGRKEKIPSAWWEWKGGKDSYSVVGKEKCNPQKNRMDPNTDLDNLALHPSSVCITKITVWTAGREISLLVH